MIDALDALEAKLRHYPPLSYRRRANGIEIEPPNEGGFAIDMYREGGGFLVNFGLGGFHQDFEAGEDAVEFVMLGLSNACRLREVRHPFLHRAILERRSEGAWTPVDEVGTISWPIVIGAKMQIFQNTLVLA